MLKIGYKLSSEEHGAPALVRNAVAAEEAGFTFAAVSDHFHPWTDRQGHSPFVWGVLGAVANATDHLHVGTAVTCPIIRMHPALVAQAAATAASLFDGRFFLGLGSGENLNEHVVSERWPSAAERREMLEEAVQAIRKLWEGGQTSLEGRFFRVRDARLYSLPEEPPPIVMAASGRRAAELAGRLGDGLFGLAPDAKLLQTFEASGGAGKPKYCEITVCWAPDEGQARRAAHAVWPNAAVEGELVVELPLPRHFEQAAKMVTEDDVAEKVVCGPDPEAHLQLIRRYAEAGYDHVCVHQVGPDQDGFLSFYRDEVLPKL